MALKTINERSALTVQVTFQDTNWKPVQPTPIRYRIDDLTNNTTIIDWTDLDPTLVSATGVIPVAVTADQNAIVNTSNSLERRELTVEAAYSTSLQFVDTFDWQVRNIKGVS